METILFLSTSDTIKFKNVENFKVYKSAFDYEVEFDYVSDTSGNKNHLVMTGVIGYANPIRKECAK